MLSERIGLTNGNSDQLRHNVLGKNYYCDIDIAHLISYNEDLAHKLTSEPADIIPLVRTMQRIHRYFLLFGPKLILD